MKGRVLRDKYKIIEVLGQNAFSKTYLARDLNWYSPRRYVIKKFRPILGNSQAKEIEQLFYREASILKLLRGKNSPLPHLYEYFMDGEDFYLIREWIKGITLEQKVQQQGKLSETEVKEILNSILFVLEYIHNYGLVYRQLKPSSIVMRQSSWRDRKYVSGGLLVPIYFGGVKELEKQAEQANRRSLVLANQPEYVSPEQQRGQSVYASDLYSLGWTAIYLLTGKTPKELKSDPYTNCPVWQQEAPLVSNNFVRVINRAICPNINDRFISPEQMLRALNSQSVNISTSLITQSEKKFVLAPEVKITAILFALTIGLAGITIAMLNIDFTEVLEVIKVSQSHFNSNSSDSKLELAPINSSQLPEIPPDPLLNIPAIRVDTRQEQIINLLGVPTKISRGYWGNSQAYLYRDFVPKQVDLGYLVDVNTKTIRQSEMTFADSVKAVDIHQAIRLMLLDSYSAEIEQKINRVFNGESDQQQFEVDNLTGIIQRNEQNRIFIAIWNRGFHQ